MTPENQQELKWIQESKRDPEAFEPLFNKYQNAIFNYILRRTCREALAKDLTASTFMKALNNIHQFQWRGIPFSAWLYRIATNEINQHFRKHRKTVHLTDAHIETIQSDSKTDDALMDSEARTERRNQSRKVYDALTRLKKKYQDVLTLRYYEDLSIKEIAKILGIPENTVKTHTRRGLQQLKKLL
ncbi:RNA polymerase sigma factor [candidate division KSB1 bacterium]|nr:RNA polymerase sigma factor [candidate division KSB1 bacterium]